MQKIDSEKSMLLTDGGMANQPEFIGPCDKVTSNSNNNKV